MKKTGVVTIIISIFVNKKKEIMSLEFNELSENKLDESLLENYLKHYIKVAFENTVMCARTNSAQESYDYAERMADMIIKKIEESFEN